MAYTSWSVSFGEQPSAAKWNILGSNDAHFYGFLGDNEAWTSFTPTWTNLTIGNATQVGKYYKVGNAVLFRLSVVFGNSTSMGSVPYFTPPVTAIDYADTHLTPVIGSIRVRDDSVGTVFSGFCVYRTTNSFQIQVSTATGGAGTGIGQTDFSSTVPWTWTTGDEFYIQGFYESAT